MSNANELNDNKTVILDDCQVTAEQFNERLRTLKNNERVVETSTDNYYTLTRMNG